MRLLHYGLCTLIILTSCSLNAQFSDNFNDGDLDQNPTWSGDSAHFKVISGVLQLSAPSITDTHCLTTTSEVGLEARWSLQIILDFNPSSSNYCRIYLMSDSRDLKGSLHGYFVNIGGSSDEVSLYRQDGASLIKLIDGRDNSLNKSSNNLSIEVVRDQGHNWTLKSDTGASAFISEGIILDSTYLQSEYFGISCRHTSSRSDKFHFDDVNVSGQVYKDLSPPIILSHRLVNDRTWEILFDEELNQVKLKPEWFSPQFNGGVIRSVDLSADKKLLTITFEQSFPHGQHLGLSIDSISDTLGNSMKSQILQALYNDLNQLRFKDIVINEIMFDPMPPNELPIKEYLEIHNRSGFYLDLSSWKITDEKDSVSLPASVMAPNDIILLISQGDSLIFEGLPSILRVPDLISLSNSGELISLLSPSDMVIDSVDFRPSWISDADKRDGGWSLELINPEYYCVSNANWTESIDQKGGSPGEINSVFNLTQSREGLDLDQILKINDSLLEVSYAGDFMPVKFPEKHLFLNPAIPVSNYMFNESRIELTLSSKPVSNTLYTLNVKSLQDCYLNEIQDHSIRFIFPEPTLAGDLIINEILFNPHPGESDFVEIYNNSNKYLDLSQTGLSGIRDEKLTEFNVISGHYLGINPNEFIAICDDSSVVKERYSSIYGKYHQVSLPPYNDQSGHVVLSNLNGDLIDHVPYSEDMHFSLIEEKEGISLERLFFDISGTDPSNWHSAGSFFGYATPGYQNSQSMNENNSTSSFFVQPDIFSPDNDAYNDILRIEYKIQKEGFVGSIRVMDKEGKIVRNIASNVLLGREGHFIWDGSDEQRKKAPVGYYIVYMEMFDEQGTVKHFKTTVVLAHHL